MKKSTKRVLSLFLVFAMFTSLSPTLGKQSLTATAETSGEIPTSVTTAETSGEIPTSVTTADTSSKIPTSTTADVSSETPVSSDDTPNESPISVMSADIPIFAAAADTNGFYIEDGVLTKYDGIDENVIIPNTVTAIADRAFYNDGFITSVTIPASVVSIGDEVFMNCTNLKSATIGTNVKTIGHSAFMNCPKLEAIAIPNSVTALGHSAFKECYLLSNVTIGTGLTALADDTFSADNFRGNTGSIKSITIPGNVKIIGKNAFTMQSQLTSVTLSNGVSNIGERAFYFCQKLTTITLPNSVEAINKEAFANCTSLPRITIPGSVKNIGESAFVGCPLTEVAFSEGIESIDTEAFYGAPIENLILPDSLKIIGESAFRSRSWESGGVLKSVTFGNGLERIEDYAFTDQFKLVEPIIIPDSVTFIGECAFRNHNAKEIVVGRSVKELGWQAFSSQNNSADIKATFRMKEIPEFLPCDGTTAYRGTKGDTFGLGNRKIDTLYVPTGMRAQYLRTEYFRDFNVVEIEISHPCDNGHTWSDYVTTTPATAEATGVETRTCSGCGIKETRDIPKIVVNTAPTITTQPTNQTATEGQNAVFTVAASGNPTPTYQWQVSTNNGSSWTNISGATSATYTLTGTTAAQNNNQYRCVVTNSHSAVNSNAAKLTVNAEISTDNPAITTQPTNQDVMAGLDAVFTVAASGNPTPTYQWQVSTNNGSSWTNISGAKSAIYTLSKATATQSGNQYRCVVTNSQGTVNSNAVTLTVHELNGEELSFLDDEVKIWAEEGIIPEGAEFGVLKIMPPPPEVVEKVNDQLGKGTVIIAYYEVTLLDEDGNLITTLNGEITIGSKLPEGYESGKGVSVYQEDENGILIKMESWVADGYIYYKTDWLEIYN